MRSLACTRPLDDAQDFGIFSRVDKLQLLLQQEPVGVGPLNALTLGSEQGGEFSVGIVKQSLPSSGKIRRRSATLPRFS